MDHTIGMIVSTTIVVGIWLAPILGAYFENSQKRVGRFSFMIWVFLFYIIIPVFLWNMETGKWAHEIYAISLVIWKFTEFFVMQRYVRRARDCGFGKVIAYLSMIPFLNILTTFLLLISPTVKEA